MKTQIRFKTGKAKLFLMFFFLFFFTLLLKAQTAESDDGDKDQTNYRTWSWIIDDNNNDDDPGYYRWWTDGGDNINQLLMELSASDQQLTTFGELKIINKFNRIARHDNLSIWADGTRSYIQSNGDEDGLQISSKTGNKITLGDSNDVITIGTANFTGDENGLEISSKTGNKITLGDGNDVITIGTANFTGDANFAASLVTINGSNSWDNMAMWSDGTASYIQSTGDEDGLHISSNTGNKITLGDGNDVVTIGAANFTKPLYTINGTHTNDSMKMWTDGTRSYIQSTGDEDGLQISSKTGNKITLGDSNDVISIGAANFSKPLYTINGIYTSDNMKMWTDGTRSYIETTGDEDGLQISSKTGNKITLGDSNDVVFIPGSIGGDIKGDINFTGNTSHKSIIIPSYTPSGAEMIIGKHIGIGGGYGDFGLKVNKGNINLVTEGLEGLGGEIRIQAHTNVSIHGTTYFRDTAFFQGGIRTQDVPGNAQPGDNMALWSDANGSYIESNGDEDGLLISSKTGNKITLGDGNDEVHINGTLYAENFVFGGTDIVKLGNGAGSGITANPTKSHVFIGHDAGNKAGFDAVVLIDYEDAANTNPITGTEYLENHSVFVLNNSSDLTKPLLFGNFAKDDDNNSMAQLAINTHHVVDSTALTVSGSVHIGPKNINPTVFPSKKGYEDALLWVEKGIVTEDVIYAFTSNWKDWPDYVFEEDYDLMELNELDEYIRREKHLPGIISMEEVKEEGLKSTEIIIDLLMKIEEITLYTIAQEKKIEQQKQVNKGLLKRLIAIEEQLKN